MTPETFMRELARLIDRPQSSLRIVVEREVSIRIRGCEERQVVVALTPDELADGSATLSAMVENNEHLQVRHLVDTVTRIAGPPANP